MSLNWAQTSSGHDPSRVAHTQNAGPTEPTAASAQVDASTHADRPATRLSGAVCDPPRVVRIPHTWLMAPSPTPAHRALTIAWRDLLPLTLPSFYSSPFPRPLPVSSALGTSAAVYPSAAGAATPPHPQRTRWRVHHTHTRARAHTRTHTRTPAASTRGQYVGAFSANGARAAAGSALVQSPPRSAPTVALLFGVTRHLSVARQGAQMLRGGARVVDERREE